MTPEEQMLAELKKISESLDKQYQRGFNFSAGSDPSTGAINQPMSGRTYQEQLGKYTSYGTSLAKTMKDQFNTYVVGVNDTFKGFAENYEKINRAIGGYLDHSKLAESSEITLVQAVRRLDDYIDMYGSTTDEFIKQQQEKGRALTAEEEARFKAVGVDFVTKYFESGEEAAKIQSEILNKLITQNADAINKMNRASRAELALIQKNTGISATRIAKILENQIVETGEATNDAFFKITGYSDKLAKETGLSFKLIQDSTTRVMENYEKFGNVSVEQSQRIAVQIQQLGMKFETFTALTDKFQDFSTSANAMGQLSQLTGGAVQLDAQELSYLASEDQDEFLRELRRSFIDQGFDSEQFLAMTNAEQKAIAQSIGMSREEFAMLINRERKISTKEQLDMAMKEAQAAGATGEAAAMERIKAERVPLENAIKNTDDAVERARRAALKNAKEYATTSMKDLIGFQTDLVKTLNIGELSNKFTEPMIKGLSGITAVMKEQLAGLVNDPVIPDAMKGAGKNFNKELIDVAQAGGSQFGEGYIMGLRKAGVYPASLPPAFQKIVDSVAKYMPKEMEKAFEAVGGAVGDGFNRGIESAGVNPSLLLKSIGAINEVKTAPILLQKNVERVSQLLADLKEKDINQYQLLIDELSKNIKTLNEKNEALSKNQEELIKALLKDTSVIVNLDGVQVGKGILNKVPEINTAAGLKFVTESE